MQENTQIKCPECKNEIPEEVFYCPICGKKIREKPAATDFWHLLLLLGLSTLLPPFNISMSVRYIKSPDPKAKMYGWISIGVMILALTIVTIAGIKWAQEVNKQVNQEMERLLGF